VKKDDSEAAPVDERQKRAADRLQFAADFGWRTTPQEIAQRLRHVVVGQDVAVEAVSVMLHQHLMARVRRAASGMPAVRAVRIPPILLIGPTGCGKTTLMRGLAAIASLPYSHHDASMATEAGWYGETPGVDYLRACLHAADQDPTLASLSIMLIDEICKIALSHGPHRDISGAGAQDGMLRLLEGGRHTVEMGEPGMNGGARRYQISMDSSNLLIVCAGAFSGLDEIVRCRLLGPRTLGFGASASADVRDLASDELLRRVRPEDLISYGLKPELVGRLAEVIVMPSLSREAMRRIASDTSQGPIMTLQHIASTMGFQLRFPTALVDRIVDMALASGLGARGMHLYANRAARRAFLEVPGIVQRAGRSVPWGCTVAQLRGDSLENGYYAVRQERASSRQRTAMAGETPTRRRRSQATGG
jgi:ATP-dependent Clp protease ATP-binding subunit ClpX